MAACEPFAARVLGADGRPADIGTAQDGNACEAQAPTWMYASACIATVARSEPRLVDDDVAKQPAEEIAPALLGQHGGGRWGSRPKVRDSAPVSRSIGVPSCVPEVK